MFSKAWRGEERLWKVWWLIGLLLLIPIGTITIIARLPELPVAVFITLLVTQVVLYFAWFRMAWTCAKNVNHIGWMYAARVVVVLKLGMLFQQLLST